MFELTFLTGLSLYLPPQYRDLERSFPVPEEKTTVLTYSTYID
jgi:hypothetical protein